MDDDEMKSLADLLLPKEEDDKPDEKPDEEENKSAEGDKPEDIKPDDKPAEKDDKKPEDDTKPEDKGDDKSKEGKKVEEEKKPEDTKPDDDKPESKPAEEDTKPLSREDIRAAMREEAVEREKAATERTTFAGKVRDDLKEALKLDSTYTTVTLDDGTPIQSVAQLTQVINPETAEPYTREEAQSLLMDARRIVDENLASYEKRVDELTDLNVNFKEEADRVDELYGDIFKAFPEEAKGWLAAYQKTFKLSEDGSYVENVPISPLEFYKPILAPYRNATDQLKQQETDTKAAEAKAVKDAEIAAEQEDRGDLGAAAGAKQGKTDLLDDAMDKYLKDNA